MLLYVFAMTTALASAGKSWSKGHDHGNLVDVSGPKSHLERLEVVCSKDHMTVHMHFDEPFYGVVFSHGTPRHERCVHVGPRAGITSASFDIKYDGCGTVEHLSGQFHENTIVIQFDEDILEAWDQAKRLRCEWLESFEKPSSKPTLSISDLDVVELNFQGDDIDCWMEVQEGKGPWARQVGGLVPIGSPLTLVIAINDHSREFDMRIKRCSASDGKGNEIELTDENGCVLRPSLLTPFAKVRDFGGKATLVAYSHLYAFKFPDKMDVFVHCIVEVCRHGCPDSCSHQYKDYHRPGGSYDSLESKKIEKLKEFANSKSVHDIHVSGHHKSFGNYPVREEVLVPAAQTQVKHVTEKNSTFNAAVFDSQKVAKVNARPSFKPITLAKKEKETKSQAQTAASNVQAVFVDVDNDLQLNHHLKLSHSQEESKSVQTSNVHRIIGHDIHWISDVADNAKELSNKPSLPSLKDISYQAPKPEPSTWSADDVKPLTKHEVYQNHPSHKSGFGTSIHQQVPSPPEVPKTYTHWSGNSNTHTSLHSLLPEKVAPVPQPEPATWSADDVRPLTKDNVFHVQEQPEPIQKITVVHHKPKLSETPKTYTHWSSGNTQSYTPPQQKVPAVPLPEPASWTFDEVNPMHSPEVIRLQLHTKRPDEPKPEPTSWTLDDVKGLTKEELRLLSLNHKMHSQTRVIAPPVYKEFVHSYSTTTIPQPVYVSRYTLNPQNMSSTNMMKMMMMMPTMLPATYQSAYWPHRTTARYLKPQRHHYPYPIPQFSPHQQMMMSVIADRRMDDENADESPSEDLSLYQHSNLDETPEIRRIEIGQTANEDSKNSQNDTLDDKAAESVSEATDTKEKIMIGEIFESRTTPETKPNDELPADSFISTFETSGEPAGFQSFESTVAHQESSPEAGDLEGASAVRPPISGFVPPSLDDEVGVNPESKERIVPGPRSLERKKRSSEPIFGVQQKFQAIAPSDLAYEWNLTSESAALLKGIREEIVYGICISPAGMSAGVGLILILTLLSIIASVILYEHSCRLSHKTSQLSFLTKNFNGQFEAIYRFTRPYLYPDSRNVR